MTDAIDTYMKRRLEGAYRYAKANRSDPFALARALVHVRNGIAGRMENGEDGIYDAEKVIVERLTEDGRSYLATEYHNIRRP